MIERMRCKLKNNSTCNHTVRILCRCPSVLGLSPERNVQAKLDCLVRLGVEPDDLRRVVLLVPQLLTLSQATIMAKVAAPPSSRCRFSSTQWRHNTFQAGAVSLGSSSGIAKPL